MIGGGLLDYAGSVWDGIKADVSSPANSAVQTVRQDLANAVNNLGAAATSAAAGAIAPQGKKPVTVPLTANQVTMLAIGGVLVVLLILYLAFRRKR